MQGNIIYSKLHTLSVLPVIVENSKNLLVERPFWSPCPNSLTVFPNKFVYFSYFQLYLIQYQTPMSIGSAGCFTNC